MEYKAYQIAPEYQESPLEFADIGSDCWGGIIVCGNREFRDYKTREFEHIERYFDDMADEWIDREYNGYTSIAEILHDYGFECPTGAAWSNNQKHAWRVLFESGKSITDTETMLSALELMTGNKYVVATIRGCCQGDWNMVYYPVDVYDREQIAELETEYFNTGSEWRIVNAEDEDDEVCCYAHGWHEEAIRKELADSVGCKPEEMRMFAFDGWTRTPNYRGIA